MPKVASSPHAQPVCRFEDALDVIYTLRSNSHVAYFAGGCVRDRVMGLPSKDWDVATDAEPSRVRHLFKNTQAVGQAFGVILVRHNQSTIEVATFRSDGAYDDGRRPNSVKFVNAEQDAQRRDFTINGLFWDPIEDRIIDYVDGVRDINSKILRAIGSADVRFSEDYLRMLRAVRFAARLDLTIHPDTRRAIEANRHSLVGISPERIADELRTMLCAITRDQSRRLLNELRLMPILMRFLDAGASEANSRDGAIFDGLAPRRAIGFGLVLAALIVDWRAARSNADPALFLTENAARLAVSAMRKSLRISNEESDELAGVTESAHLLNDAFPRVAVLKRFLARPFSNEARLLLNRISQAGWHQERIVRLEAAFESFDPNTVAPIPLLNGDDLVSLGYSPGKAFKIVLDFIYDEQLEDRVSTKEQAIDLARSEYPKVESAQTRPA